MASGSDKLATSENAGKKRKLSGTSSWQSNSDGGSTYDSREESLSDFAYQSSHTLPSCISAWDVECLQSLSICYEFSSDTVDDVLVKPLMLPLLDNELTEVLNQLKTCLLFDIDMNELENIDTDNFFKCIVRGQLETTKRRILAEFANVENCHKVSVKPVLDFLEDIVCMVIETKDGTANKEVFSDCFRSFVSMCQLSPKNGASHNCTVEIKGVKVASFPDLRIKCVEEEDILFMQNKSQAVVSIVEDMKYRSRREIPEKRNTCVDVEPRIYENLDKKVLGRHGGQLLLEWTLCSFKHRYMPGIIVSGSKIFFTLLDLNKQHYRKLGSNEELDVEDSANIYYTDGFDILKKNDRDMLMETLLRLSMLRASRLANKIQ